MGMKSSSSSPAAGAQRDCLWVIFHGSMTMCCHHWEADGNFLPLFSLFMLLFFWALCVGIIIPKRVATEFGYIDCVSVG